MGVNVKAYLSPGTRVADVAKVAAALLGNEVKHEPIRGSDALFPRAAGVQVFNTSVVGMLDICITLNPENAAAACILESDGSTYRMSYHFEASQMGESLIMPKSTAAKIALSAALIEFFGGWADFNDGDDTHVNLYVERRSDIHATDGEEWNHLMQRILDVQPLTETDIKQYEKWAAYPQQ
jgi:hypothetical protein